MIGLRRSKDKRVETAKRVVFCATTSRSFLANFTPAKTAEM